MKSSLLLCEEVPSTAPSQRAPIWAGFTLWTVLSSLSRIIDFWLGRKSSCRLVFEVLKSSWKGRILPQTEMALLRAGCWRLHYTGIDVTAVPVWTTLFLPPPVANQRKSGNQCCCLFSINNKVVKFFTAGDVFVTCFLHSVALRPAALRVFLAGDADDWRILIPSVPSSQVTQELKASQDLCLPLAAERLMWKSRASCCEDDA